MKKPIGKLAFAYETIRGLESRVVALGHQNAALAAEVERLSAQQAANESIPDSAFSDEFQEWWEENGQFCRAGGGDYERTFAFEAWRHLYPKVSRQPSVSALVEALEEISDPIRFMQEWLEEGESLDGMAAVQLAKDASYLRGIARAALAAYRNQGGDA